MQERRWTAIWTNQYGEVQTYRFLAPDHRLLARVDFLLLMLAGPSALPLHVQLEAGRLVRRVVPSLEEVRWRT